MTNGQLSIDNSALAQRLEKHQEEVTALESAIRTKDKIIHELKPAVIEYNENMKGREELRKQLARKQRETKILAEFFTGTTIFDERFPLFATPRTSTAATEIETTESQIKS